MSFTAGATQFDTNDMGDFLTKRFMAPTVFNDVNTCIADWAESMLQAASLDPGDRLPDLLRVNGQPPDWWRNAGASQEQGSTQSAEHRE